MSLHFISPRVILPLNFRLCWEQNVHVIVMLTREIEGSMVKCGAYWAGTTFGPLRLRLMSTSSQSPPDMDNGSGYFPLQPPLGDDTKPRRQPTTIKRIFELTHGDYPYMKPRKVVHLQFLEWPDMNVPDDPHGVLELIREVEKAVEETGAVDQASMEVDEGGTDLTAADLCHAELDEKTGIAKHAMGKNSPVLLHCSAGVGRTGGFIAVDAVLDAVRRELRKSTDVVSKPCRRVSSVDRFSGWFYSKGDLMQVDEVVHESCMSESDDKFSVPRLCSSLSSSPPLALQVHSDSSSSDDSFEFDQSCGPYGNYQSSIATSPSTSSPSVQSVPHDINNPADSGKRFCSESTSVSLTIRTEYFSRSSPEQCSLIDTSVVENRGRTVRDGQGRKNASPLRSQYTNGLSDDGEPPSRSMSPSPDGESEANPLRGLSNRDGQIIIPAIPNSPPTTPPTSQEPGNPFKGPRRLHEDKSPAKLDSFKEPIWEVVQDMREQRMSLCQSLRQYVFVHAAIIEGALMIVDEENKRRGVDVQTTATRSRPTIYGGSRKTNSDPTRRLNRCRPAALLVRSNGLGSAILTGKRVASPTELPKENKWGDALLSKRPSLQRAKLP